MRVYYESSLWSKEKGICGLKQRTNWRFEYADTKRYIPAIYHFPQGVVFDIITRLDEKSLHEFYEKYEAIENDLTPLQQLCAEQEHPYQSIPLKEICLNGKQVENSFSSSSSLNIPWAREDKLLLPIRKAYRSILNDTNCFAYQRFRVPYPETNSKFEKILRFLQSYKIKSLELYTHPNYLFFPLDIHFEILNNAPEKEIYFQHPITGNKHTLYFQNTQSVEIPFEESKNSKLYITQAQYEINPALPQDDKLEFGGNLRYTEPRKNEFAPTSSASIGIIGRANGPTAIFLGAKNDKSFIPCGTHNLPLHNCFSVPELKKNNIAHFVIEGINIKICDGKEYHFK